MPRLPDPATRQVLPGGVALFNELDLSGADPALDLLLAGNRGTNLREPFEIDQPSDVVLAREPGDQARLCSSTRRTMSLVTPAYRTRERLAMMYTQ